MKTNDIIILGGILIVVILIFTSFSYVSFVPYDEMSIYSKQFLYEGLENNATPKPSQNKYLLTFDTKAKPNDFTLDVNVKKVENFQNKKVKTEGFEGLQSSPYVDVDPIDTFDPFGKTHGSVDCIGKSSSLSNSKGGLCLSNEQLYLLKTRGANATGGDFQFGSK